MNTFSDSPPPASWHNDFRLGYTPMDDTHQEFLVLVAALLTASDDSVAAALAALQAHSSDHFAQEERWMDESDFPPSECHRNEHAAVLASMEGVVRKVAAGDIEPARRLAQALIEWFPAHTNHLDSALAHWMCKRSMGGKPVVLRRKIVASAT